MWRVIAAALTTLAIGCADGGGSPAPANPPAAEPESPPPPPVAPPAEAGGGWTRQPVVGGGLGSGSATLTAVRTATHEGYDRITFEFADSLPGYRVRWSDPPIIQCGSGAHVQIAGDAVLEISFEPAVAHDEAGQATIQERARSLDLDRLREIRLTCDFEAHVDWAAGTNGRTDLRVLELREPARLAIDLRH